MSAASSAAGKRTGRRPGETVTRDEILQAARELFGERGYDRASIRDIARGAGVDPSLVIHFFGRKEELFGVAMHLPIRPGDVLPQARALGSEHAGEFIVRRFLQVWEDEANRPILMGLLRSATTNETAAAIVRRFILREIMSPVAASLEAEDAELRATLVGSQLTGLALLRYVGRLEPLASAAPETIVRWAGPTIQRYLSDPDATD